MPKYLPGVYIENVAPPEELQIVTTAFPVVTQGVFFSITLQSVGGTLPVTWSLVAPNNVLPAGVTRTGDTISGTPSVSGSFPITIRATDNFGVQKTQGPITLQVNAAGTLTVTTTSLPPAKRGFAYSQLLTAVNNSGAVTWDLVAPYNSLPTGLSLVGNRILGTPTVYETDNIVVRATDSVSNASSGVIALIVNQVDNLVISTSSTVSGREGSAYSYQFSTLGGWGPFTWSIVAGALEANLTLDEDTGIVSGTPTTAGTYGFTLEVEDSEGRTASRAFTILIDVASAEGPHDYYDYWATGAGSSVNKLAYPLRSTVDLPALGQSEWATFWTYDASMNAIKFIPARWGTLNANGTLNTGWNANGGQLVFPVNESGTSVVTVVFDFRLAQTFRDNCGGVTGYKMFQAMPGGDNWWTQMVSPGPVRNAAATYPGDAAVCKDEFRSAPELSGGEPDGLLEHEELTPAGPGCPVQRGGYSQYPFSNANLIRVPHSQWFRCITEIRQLRDPSEFTDWMAYTGTTLRDNPNDPGSLGRWHMVSRWIITQNEGPKRICYRVPMNWGRLTPDFRNYRFEFNSSKGGAIGPFEAWARNFLALLTEADESNANLFKAPVEG